MSQNKSFHSLNADKRILSLGSCFADNIASVLLENKFKVLANPFGVIYHPIPLLKVIKDSLVPVACPPHEFLHHDGLWRWWCGHGSLASKELTILEKKIFGLKTEVKDYLFSNNTILILTFGTSYLFETVEGKIPVANCQKLPGNNFLRQFTPYNEFLRDWVNTIEFLINKSPSLQIIFTVSPVRHIKDGLHENNLSKANLLLFVDELINRFKNNTTYFPAYEIMIDELRDYQFYKDDKIHPSEKSIKYIYGKFAETYFTEETSAWIKKWNAIQSELNHKPLHTQSDSYRKFITTLEEKFYSFINSYPEKDWTQEIKRLDELKVLL